ncbi:MAG: thioredoxin domain-containing protein [Candidatus Taylorbacteria bacterium]
MDPKPTSSGITIPGAIIIAAAIIAMALIYILRPVSPAPVAAIQPANNIQLSPIVADEHIFGNPSAPIKIVEFSDPSCPYCKSFNPTMTDIMTTYGPSGNVAWVYRHFPLDAIHKNARHEAQALECASSLGGNTKFWAFEKMLYDKTPSVTGETPDGLDQKQLPVFAKAIGLDEVAFNDCLASNSFKDKIQAQSLDGINAGVNGTPTSFIVLAQPAGATIDSTISQLLLTYRIPKDMLYMSDDKKVIALTGALPEALIKTILDAVIAGLPTK